MPDLRNTLAHILEHERYLAGTNEATTQQYIVLPILRALGWNDTNLASMEVLPEYTVESRRADYALHIERGQNSVVLIECKKWNEPITRHEEQVCFYAYSGNIPLAIITNGKLWRFYLSRWEASSLSDRIFCEVDIENRDRAISDLEKYLLKSNVASGESELNAEIALEEKETTGNNQPAQQIVQPVGNNFPDSGGELKAMRERVGLTQVQVALKLGLAAGSAAAVGDWEAGRLKVPLKHQTKLIALYSTTGDVPKSDPSDSGIDSNNDRIDNKLVEQGTIPVSEWTIGRVRDLLFESEEVRRYHEDNFSEDRRNLFYRRVAETQNLIEAESWCLKPPKLNKVVCSFFLRDKGVTRVRRVFGLLLQTCLPHARPIGRNGEKIRDLSIKSNPPRIFAAITEEEARQLERQYGCKFCWIDPGASVYYNIPENMSELLRVLEFAYNKHREN